MSTQRENIRDIKNRSNTTIINGQNKNKTSNTVHIKGSSSKRLSRIIINERRGTKKLSIKQRKSLSLCKNRTKDIIQNTKKFVRENNTLAIQRFYRQSLLKSIEEQIFELINEDLNEKYLTIQKPKLILNLLMNTTVFKRYAIMNNFTYENLMFSLRLGKYTILKKNTFLFHQGDKTDNFYLVLTGCIGFILTNYEDRDKKKMISREVNSIKGGAFFGEWGLIFRINRTVSAYAKENSVLLCFDKRMFKSFFQNNIIASENNIKSFVFKHIKCFKQFNEVIFNQYYREMKKIFCNIGEEIFVEGGEANAFYLVYMGSCVVKKGLSKLIMKDVGDFIGIECFFTNKYEATIYTDTDGTVLFKFLLNSIGKQIIPLLKEEFENYYITQKNILKSSLENFNKFKGRYKVNYANLIKNHEEKQNIINIDYSIIRPETPKVTNKNNKLLYYTNCKCEKIKQIISDENRNNSGECDIDNNITSKEKTINIKKKLLNNNNPLNSNENDKKNYSSKFIKEKSIIDCLEKSGKNPLQKENNKAFNLFIQDSILRKNKKEHKSFSLNKRIKINYSKNSQEWINEIKSNIENNKTNKIIKNNIFSSSGTYKIKLIKNNNLNKNNGITNSNSINSPKLHSQYKKFMHLSPNLKVTKLRDKHQLLMKNEDKISQNNFKENSFKMNRLRKANSSLFPKINCKRRNIFNYSAKSSYRNINRQINDDEKMISKIKKNDHEENNYEAPLMQIRNIVFLHRMQSHYI